MTEITQLREQLIDMQSQLAFHEDTVQALNDAVSQQQQEITVLRRQFELLKLRQDEQTAAADDQSASSPAQERPPHY